MAQIHAWRVAHAHRAAGGEHGVTSHAEPRTPSAGRRVPAGASPAAWPLEVGTGEFDRRAELPAAEAAALAGAEPGCAAAQRARGVRAAPAGTGGRSARLVEPLDAARAASASRRRRCATGAPVAARRRRRSCSAARGLGQRLLGVDGLGLGAAGLRPVQPGVPRRPAAADRDDGAPVHDRAGLSARRVQRLPAPGQLQPPAAGPADLRRRADRGGDEPGQRGDGPLGLPQPDPRAMAATGYPASSPRHC